MNVQQWEAAFDEADRGLSSDRLSELRREAESWTSCAFAAHHPAVAAEMQRAIQSPEWTRRIGKGGDLAGVWRLGSDFYQAWGDGAYYDVGPDLDSVRDAFEAIRQWTPAPENVSDSPAP